MPEEPELTPDQARAILSIKAATLDACAKEIHDDRPDIAFRWQAEARDLRISIGEDPGEW